MFSSQSVTCGSCCSRRDLFYGRAQHVLRKGRRLLLALFVGIAVLLALLQLSQSISPAYASDPCDTISADPRPPTGPTDPLIGGTVVDLDSAAGVSGATVTVYVCDDSTPSLAGTTTTDNSGEFTFASLGGPDWYYVEVSLTGPLSGMQPASGTPNPSDLIDIGPGDESLYFEFES